MGVAGGGTPGSAVLGSDSEATWSAWPVCEPRGAGHSHPSLLGASLHSGYILYPDPGFPAQSLEPLPGLSSGLAWGCCGPGLASAGAALQQWAGRDSPGKEDSENSISHFVMWTYTFQIFVPVLCGPRCVLNLVRKRQCLEGSHPLWGTSTCRLGHCACGASREPRAW